MTERKSLSGNDHKKLIIINADDFGITKGVNKAIIELVDAGIVTSTTVMTNMPYYEEISTIRNKLGVGIHFNLTTGKPSSDPNKVPSLVGNSGNLLNLTDLLEKMRKHMISSEEVEIELNAQIELLVNMDINIDHMDSHESILKYPFFLNVMKKLGSKHGIPAVRTYSPRKFDFNRLLSIRKTAISFFLAYQKIGWKQAGFKVTDKYDSLLRKNLETGMANDKLKDIFQKLPTGVLEIGVHPGYFNDEHAILGSYTVEREAELKALLSKEFLKTISASNAILIKYSDI